MANSWLEVKGATKVKEGHWSLQIQPRYVLLGEKVNVFEMDATNQSAFLNADWWKVGVLFEPGGARLPVLVANTGPRGLGSYLFVDASTGKVEMRHR